jgi:glycerol uptake facilitator-like aquaporin
MKKVLAEFAGTFAIVLVCTATSRMPAMFILYGVVFAAAYVALGKISGGHFNPAVTVGHWVTHRFATFEAIGYIVAQLAGATAAAYAIRLFVSQATWNFLVPGTLTLSAGTTRGSAMLIEAGTTLPWVFTLCVLSTERLRVRHWLVGLAAGVVVSFTAGAGFPYTGAALNPARAFAPALASGLWAYQGVYWVGPLAGGVAAATLYDLLFRRSARSAAAVARGAQPPA